MSQTAVVRDLTRLDGVRLENRIAPLGPDGRLIDDHARLANPGHDPAESCPTVRIGGLATGGRTSLAGRTLGLTTDRIRGLDVVTADGQRLVNITGQHNGRSRSHAWRSRRTMARRLPRGAYCDVGPCRVKQPIARNPCWVSSRLTPADDDGERRSMLGTSRGGRRPHGRQFLGRRLPLEGEREALVVVLRLPLVQRGRGRLKVREPAAGSKTPRDRYGDCAPPCRR